MRTWRRLRFAIAVAVAGAAVGGVATARADEGALRLREAIALALRNSPTLGAAVADVAAAEGNLTAAWGLDDFLIDASATWVENRKELVGGVQFQQPALDDLLLTAALTRPLPTGGKLGLKLSTEYTRTESVLIDPMLGPQSSLSEVVAPSLQLVFSHPLLRGIGRDAARAQRRRARAARDVATLNREASCAALLRDVIGAYWDLLFATEELEIRRALADSAREQLRVVQANIGVGKQPTSASAEVEVAIALRTEDALFAEQALAERTLELRRLLGLEVGPAAAGLRAGDRPDGAAETPPIADALQAALERNPQLAAARAQGRAAAIEIDVTENGLLPQLDLTASGGPTGNADHANTGKAFSQLGDLSSYALSAGLVFQHPIGRRAALGARDAAQAGLRKARLSEADIRLQVETAVARASAAVDVARRRIAALAQTVDTANLDLAAERARFEVGRATNFDVLRRQEEVAQAKLRQVRARTEFLKVVAVLEALTGDILPRYGVVLQ
ncbi:MAG TPA: TolC family protein [Polyangia bacterium]|nr:TolC family protein [Polyangia bacterium]